MDYIIYMNGTPFYVDTELKELKWGERDEEPISLADLRDEGQTYSLLLNKNDNSLFTASVEVEEKSDQVIKIVIPKLAFEDRFWKDQEAIRSINELSHLQDWNILAVDLPLFNRMHGDCTILDIAGTDFVVNLREKELVKLGDWDVKINLMELSKNEHGQYVGYYDLKRYQVCSADNTNKDVVKIIIPEDTKLDPFVVAPGQLGTAMKFLAANPMSSRLSASIIPTNETKKVKVAMPVRQRRGRRL